MGLFKSCTCYYAIYTSTMGVACPHSLQTLVEDLYVYFPNQTNSNTTPYCYI